MFNGRPNDDPNPFAFAAESGAPARRRSLIDALKFVLIAAAAFAVLLIVGAQSRRWLVGRITQGFETLSSAEKRHRLSQLQALGLPGLESLVGALCDTDDGVARTAFELLRTQQTDWAVLDHADSVHHHACLVGAMNAIVDRVPDDRTVWTTGLLQQCVTVSVDRQDEASRQLYTAATGMLDRMSLSKGSGPSILVDDDASLSNSGRLAIRSQPLPVSPSESTDRWTDWPATAENPPIVYRSSAVKLRPVSPDDAVDLNEVTVVDESFIDNGNRSTEPVDAAYSAASQVAAEPATRIERGEASTEFDVRPAAMLVDSPLETYDTKSVVFWLGSSHVPLREAANAELQRRGLSAEEILIATRIAAGDLQTKLDLVDDIARNGSIDPRPWLLLLLADPSRDVKLKTVSVLATIKDPAVEQHLRNHILGEPDPTVAFRIRRLLDLR